MVTGVELTMQYSLKLSPIAISATTDDTGTANLYFQSPGTFNGIQTQGNPPSNGLFIESIDIWTDTEEDGATISNLSISDTNQILGSYGIDTTQFPNYPILLNLLSSSFSLVSDSNYSAQGGLFIRNSVVSKITPVPLSQSQPYQFLPSGLFLQSTYTSPSGQANMIVRANINAMMVVLAPF